MTPKEKETLLWDKIESLGIKVDQILALLEKKRGKKEDK
jgi:hypothetical protein